MKENPYNSMDKEAHRIAYLIAGFIKQTLTEGEHDELDDWVNASDRNMQLFEDLTDEDNLAANMAWMEQVQTEHSFSQLQESGAFQQPAKRIKLNPVWIAAAASVALLVGSYLIFKNTKTNTASANEMAKTDTPEFRPGGNRATLTLSNGTVVNLTTAKNGLLKNENGSDILKAKDGTIVYEPDGTQNVASALNTLSTPVGGQYQVKLPDGTMVWLNAASTLIYPARFSEKERNVEINGEAYFEVAKNEKQPFRVLLSDNSTVTVLGTHFNVMSYDNEAAKEVSLLEGHVSVSKGNLTKKLEPGMQATIEGGNITEQSGVDMEEVTGWKNGFFVFHDAPIEAIMRQVERWYDAKVVYQGKLTQLFNATVSRNEPLPELLRLLELNGYVHFKTVNKTIYVLP
jgi:transmembrane sensor